jgi:hypothetical protein
MTVYWKVTVKLGDDAPITYIASGVRFEDSLILIDLPNGGGHAFQSDDLSELHIVPNFEGMML